MPRGKPGTGPYAGRGSQTKKVTYNAVYMRDSKKHHPGMSDSKKRSAK